MTLGRELQQRASGEVRFSTADRAMYAYDAPVYRVMPIGVVPKSIDDVIQGLEVCREHGVPIYGREFGTSLAGQCCNNGVVFDFSKYLHGVLDIDAEREIAQVLPVTICDSFVEAAQTSSASCTVK